MQNQIVNIPTIFWVLLAGLLVTGVSAFFIKKNPKTRKLWVNIGMGIAGLGVIGIVLIAIGLQGSFIDMLNKPLFNQTKTVALGGANYTISYSAVGNGQGQGNGQVNVNTYQPTATYSTIGHWDGNAVSGTSYYKAGSNKATSTAITNTDPTVSYKYWVSNTTVYVEPKSFIGGGTNTVVNSEAYTNGSITINGYDLIGDQAVTSGTSANASLSSGTAKIKFTVLGSATTSAMPFGGVLVVEANSTIAQITCSGDGISSGTQYSLTYQPTYTTSRYVVYNVAPKYDVSPDGLVGVTKTFECTFTSSTDSPGSSYFVKMIPANWYYVNSNGDFVLDVEKSLNGLTTRTGLGTKSSTFYWNV